MPNPDVSVVVPLFNEEENINALYDELTKVIKALGKTYEIILVDDGSTDDSYNLLKKISKKDKNVKVIKFRKNFGQTAALSAGFDNANGEAIISMDGDLQSNPNDIPDLLMKLDEGYDVVTGWRYERKDSLSKKLISKMANWFRKRLLNETIHDSGCTLRAYRSHAIKGLKLYGEMHRYIPTLLGLKGYKIYEIKVQHRERLYGTTRYKSSRVIKGFLDLMYVKFWADYSTRPIHLFGSLGLIQFLFSLLILVEQIIKALLIGKLILGPLLLLSVVFLITGTLFILFGFLTEIQIRTYYEKIGEKPYEIEIVSTAKETD